MISPSRATLVIRTGLDDLGGVIGVTVAEEAARSGAWSAEDREWRFTAMPPPGRGAPLTEGASVDVLLRATRLHAEFIIGGRVVARVGRSMLHDWLRRRDLGPNLRRPPLLLRRDQEVIWFQLAGHTAPMIFTRLSISVIVRVLRN